ncbi:MAG: recombination mediator RecR [Mycoplasmataceae bacterium]|jgi:recombination protein RecR|nr:recombination mediator RecR [Mycoplasmataceae bacterium]
MVKTIEYLIDALKSLPGVGKKQAISIAYFLINQDDKYVEELIKRIRETKTNVFLCTQCNNYTDGQKYCSICLDETRDQTKLCVVKTVEELNKIEATNFYHGLFFVLNDEIDVRTKKNISSETIKKLIVFLEKKQFEEVILATNLTLNGESTAIYLKKVINQILPEANVYRIAAGLPFNSQIDYADETTLKHAFNNKVKF